MPVTQELKELEGANVDLVVIGGGIVGAGVAWDAALRGLDVVLFERRDFASGTSSRSSKLIHGGLRYLQQGEIKLIYEAVNERRRLRKLARHLVRPLGFYFPRYQGQKPGIGMMRVGLIVYEALTGFRVDHLHRRLGPGQTLAEVPGLRPDGLKGSLFYYDAKAADARIVWEAILGARQAGAAAFNYTSVTAVDRRGGRWHVTATASDGAKVTLQSTVVLAAVGPWGNVALKQFFPHLETHVRPTKGIHLVVPQTKLPLRHAVVLESPRDKRVTFAIPGRGYVYVGTTDTDYHGDIDEPSVDREDAEYMLEILRTWFPAAGIGAEDVTASWSGLRPLVEEAGKSAYQVSREHQINEIEPGFLTIEGGKLTTYRLMAEQAVDAVLTHVLRQTPGRHIEPCYTKHEPLPGGRGIHDENDLDELVVRVQSYLKCDSDVAHHLVFSYGSRVLAMLDTVAADSAKVDPALPYTWGELDYVIAHESVRELEDLFLRRTEVYYQAADNGLGIAAEAVRRMAAHLGTDEAWQEQALTKYRARCAAGLAWRGVGGG